MSHTFAKQPSKKFPGLAHVHIKGGPWVAKKPGDGVVRFHVHGPTAKIKAEHFTSAKLIEVLQVGLPIGELTDLQASLAVPTEKLALMLGVSKATLYRLKLAGETLSTAVSGRVVRYARLLGKAINVFGDEEDARQWLGSPQFGLGGAVPLEYAQTEVGAREVENLLGRIEYGVYS